MKGIVFDRNRFHGVQEEWDGQFTIASVESPGVEVTYQTTFRPDGDGSVVWTPFSKDGRLANSDESWVSGGEPLAGAIAVRFTLQPGEKRVVPMVISWDLPVVEFGSGRQLASPLHRLLRHFRHQRWKIAADGLQNAALWSDAIDAWQAPYINDESKPLWYRGVLFNEMYILADGGSFWGRPVGSDPKTPHTFSFMECFDYPYYGTLDVRFYGSMPLAKFWPEIDKQVMRQFADTVHQELTEKSMWQWKTEQTGTLALPRTQSKRRGAARFRRSAGRSILFSSINSDGRTRTTGKI